MMNGEKDSFKSRYRGVYRCGKKWKAQLQSHGIQFYLGMFDTEEEAARAYDRKAREEKGGKNPINFEVKSGESESFQHRPSSPSYRYYGGGEEDDDVQFQSSRKFGLPLNQPHSQSQSQNNKRARSEEDQDSSAHLRRLDYQSTTENMKILWDRHCQIAQRLLLAKAAQSKLAEFQAVAPDTEKETILKALSEEIILLLVVKSQLEEAVSRCFRLGLDLNTSSVPPPAPVSAYAPAAASHHASAAPAGHQFPVYHQDWRNSDSMSSGSSSLPPFRPSFGGGSSNSGMQPYYFPQLPPFPTASGSGVTPLQKPYVSSGAPPGGYFGQTFPPSALPSLTLPNTNNNNSANISNSFNGSNNHVSRSMAPPPNSAVVGAATPASNTAYTLSANGAAGAGQGTGVSGGGGGLALAPAAMTAAMSSFQALTQGPSLLGNTSLLSPPALMDTVLVGNGRLPPPPQVPLPSPGFEPPPPPLSSSALQPPLPLLASSITTPAAGPQDPVAEVEVVVAAAASPDLSSATLDQPASGSSSNNNTTTTSSTGSSACAEAKPVAAAAHKPSHKVVQQLLQGTANNVSTEGTEADRSKAVSNKRSAAAMEGTEAIETTEKSEAAAPPKESPKESPRRGRPAKATAGASSSSSRPAPAPALPSGGSTGAASAGSGSSNSSSSEQTVFQLSAEQEKAIISAAVAASKSRKGAAAAAAREQQQKIKEEGKEAEVKPAEKVNGKDRVLGKETEAAPQQTGGPGRRSGAAAVPAAVPAKEKSAESAGRRTSTRR